MYRKWYKVNENFNFIPIFLYFYRTKFRTENIQNFQDITDVQYNTFFSYFPERNDITFYILLQLMRIGRIQNIFCRIDTTETPIHTWIFERSHRNFYIFELENFYSEIYNWDLNRRFVPQPLTRLNNLKKTRTRTFPNIHILNTNAEKTHLRNSNRIVRFFISLVRIWSDNLKRRSVSSFLPIGRALFFVFLQKKVSFVLFILTLPLFWPFSFCSLVGQNTREARHAFLTPLRVDVGDYFRSEIII